MKNFISLALNEDLGSGDVTSESSVPADLAQKGYILAKESGVVAGVEVAREVIIILLQLTQFLLFMSH